MIVTFYFREEDQPCEYNYAPVGENIYEELCSVGENKYPQV